MFFDRILCVILGLNTFDQKNKTRYLLNINQIPRNICLDLIKELPVVSQQFEENTVFRGYKRNEEY